MKLRELGLSKQVVEGLDIMEAPMCSCGCGNKGDFVVQKGENPKNVIADLVGGYECPKALGVLINGKKMSLFARPQLFGDEFKDKEGIMEFSFKGKNELELNEFIKEYGVEHLVVLNLGVRYGDRILEVVESY